MRIDASIADLVCVQLPDHERAAFQAKLRGLSTGCDMELRLLGENGIVIFQIVPSGVQIHCSDRSVIRILLSKSECDYLADAIAENISDASTLPLDHSFESLGATITPTSIKDVVIETYS
jgi:hypothetical protein